MGFRWMTRLKQSVALDGFPQAGSMSFIFTVCQVGAENALKDEIAHRYSAFRFAFSRPGFVTFRIPNDVRRDRQFELKSVFARTWGFSIGKVTGTDGHDLIRRFHECVAERFPKEEVAKFDHLHVWERDKHVPGDRGLEPGVTPLADEIGHMLLNSCGPEINMRLNEAAQPDERVLDCVLVKPGEWWIGRHRVTSVPASWPGGVPDVDVADDVVSRTYLKMVEALSWSEFPIESGDRAVEIGSSPGGSCQALLERGLAVTGIDPADMDEALLQHPYFTHVKARAKDLKRRAFSEFRWLMSDASVAPNYTLDTVEHIVKHKGVNIEGLLLTLKLTDWKLASAIPDFHRRIRSWGYRYVRSRQLAYNRREICVAASDWK